MLKRASLLLALAHHASAENLGEVPTRSAADVGFTQRWGELPEKQRLKLRDEAGWKWSFPGENKKYREWQEHRTEEIQDLYHFQERLDNWCACALPPRRFSPATLSLLDDGPGGPGERRDPTDL